MKNKIYEIREQINFDDVIVYQASWIDLLHLVRKNGKGFLNYTNIKRIEEKEEQNMFYAVYQDTLKDGSYDKLVDVYEKVSDAIRVANELANSQVFAIEE